MKQVTMENVKERIARIENAEHVIKCARMSLSIQNEFELACLRELVAVTEQVRLLTEQRDAVVAEMVKLQNFCKNAAFDADYKAELGMERGGFTDALNDIETPATSSAIAALRAEARSSFVDDAVAAISESGALTVGDCIVAVCQLRESKGGNRGN